MVRKLQEKRLATRAVHAGERTRPDGFIPMSTPIYSTATFIYDHLADIDAISAGERSGFTYSRHGNPTNAALEGAVASLEGGGIAASTASGMSAILLALLAAGIEQGTTVVASQDLYGVTVKFLLDVAARWGVRIEFVDMLEPSRRNDIWTLKPSLLLLESLTNPLLRVPDLPALAAEAHAHGARVIVDNTFATPLLLRPLEHGADFVVHSATKYLGGHGDLTGGILVAREDFAGEVRQFTRLVGANLGPFEAWLALRGLKTLPLRFAQHCKNAQRLAEWLVKHPKVEQVFYPGLANHPDHERASRLFGGAGAGGVLSLKIRGAKRDEVFRFVDSLELFLKATSLGDVQSLVLYPAISSHRDLSPKQRDRLGITENLVRLSAGIEDVEDLIEDLKQGLSQI
ncbi:MAG TPA: PLP-dependent aspartate aminotransferase family protein [Candidatus Acidoferrales bacterium]|nr:PLP-dependent aspartate aminotransferase family protein [Candidatus Acidoferrales bacterium]